MSVTKTLTERGKSYGRFDIQAAYSQLLKSTFRDSPHWDRLQPYQRESLEMIAVKLARILHGDPNHVDGWHDIAGYATLVESILTGNPI